MCCRDIPPPMKGEIFYSNVEANISRIRNARFRDTRDVRCRDYFFRKVERDDDVGLWILFEKDSLRDCIFGGNDEWVIELSSASFLSGRIDLKSEIWKKGRKERFGRCMDKCRNKERIYLVCRIYYFHVYCFRWFLNFVEIWKIERVFDDLSF